MSGFPISPPGDIEALEHARRWQTFVDTRSLSRPTAALLEVDSCSPNAALLEAGYSNTTSAQLIRHMRNEEVLLGTARSVRVHVPEAKRRG